MIKTKEIDISINSGNIGLYKKRGSIGDIIRIDISEISSGSSIIIVAVCDFCGNEKSISYKLYNRSIKNHEKFACCKKCSSLRNKDILYNKYGVENISMVPYVKEKIKKTNFEKYGNEVYMKSEEGMDKIKNSFIEKYKVDNPQKDKIIRDKTKKTNLEKYGHECSLESEDIKEKKKKTNLRKYGYESPSKSIDVKNKMIETNILRYGGNSPMCDDVIKFKSRVTILKNYGVDSPLKSELIRTKIKETNLKIRGVEYPTQCDDVKLKVKETIFLRYGSSFISGSELIRNKYYKISGNKYYIRYLSDKISLFNCDLDKDHTFEIHTDNYFSRIKNNTPLCTICNSIGDSSSIKERILLDYIKSIYKNEIINGYRDGIEIDIYLPDIKIGFEFNGLYWHTEEYRDRYYHYDKTNYFKEKGIHIFHIWEDDWDTKNDIIKSQISNFLNKTENKIFARNCEIRKIEKVDCYDFLNNNHIQGYVNSVIKIGLYYNDELVSVMTFDQNEGRKKMKESEWNLSRFCNKTNNTIVGGASKLLRYFIKTYKPTRIISYADNSWSRGNLYKKIGFDCVSEVKPDYKYKVGNLRLHKSRFRKSKLNTDLSESFYMKQKKIWKIWDCGKTKFEIVIY